MSETNEQGNSVERYHHEGNRYDFDFGLCSAANGWSQFDTDQDASYFGVWVHSIKMHIFTYAEGDAILVRCESAASFAAELNHMESFYGSPPPFAVVIDGATGEATTLTADRPSA